MMRVVAAAALDAPISLRRDGLRPLCFRGTLIAENDGWLPNAALWHEVALYRAESGHYVVTIVARVGGSAPRAARCHAIPCETLEVALSTLENHDTSGDVCPGLWAAFAFNNAALSPASLAMQATMLHGFCQDILNRYRIGIGALLAGIGLRPV